MTNDQELSTSSPALRAHAGRIDRRSLVLRAAGIGAGFAASAAGSRLGVAAQDAAASPTAAAAGLDAMNAIVAAATAFLDTLSDDERSAVSFDWSDSAQKQRWSNLPEGGFQRAGVMWGNLSEAAQTAWVAVMQATLSEEGYTRVLAEWNADDQLGGGGGGLTFGTAYYWIAIIGEPSASGPWQWQWGGHHVTINATVSGANLALTPSFIGVQPGTYTDANGDTVRPLGDIADEAFALVNSLDADQQATAILGDSYMDLVLGPGQDGKTIQSEGLPASQMSAEQQTALLHLIGHYSGLANDAAAAARMAVLESDLVDTYLAWYGSTAEGNPAYFRITGPTVVIEYSPQGMGGDPANHIHGIYRDPTNDYGATFTGITLGS